MENSLIGQRLKKRRTELNLSLRDLASTTQLTAAFLSQVERGISNPSLNSLRRISTSLNVPMLYFMAEGENRSPVVRSSERSHIELEESNVSYELLTPDLTGSFVSVLGSLKPGNENIVRSLNSETEEMIHVLSGVLCVGLGEEDYILSAGDSITFRGKDLTRMICGSNNTVKWISVITPPVF
ncbi:MAG: helix-turn-helix domain-containing protein [Anaerolineaceae bacterium]